MAVATSAVDICNLALDMVGEAAISSIENPTTKAGRAVARNYDFARRTLLREVVWNFAKKYKVVTRSGTPDFNYTDAYTFPGDFIRFLSFDGDSEEYQNQSYDIVGRDLYVNNGAAASIKLRYIADIQDVSKFEALFTRVLVLRLALDLAYTITKDERVIKRINELLTIEFPAATSIDGQERPPKRIQKSKYLQARQGGYSNTPGYYVD